MDKENLAYKLTADVFKHYKISELEEQYNLSGGKLITAIFNEIYNEINFTDNSSTNNDSPAVVFYGENQLSD